MKNLDVFAGQCVRFSCSIEPAEHGPLVGALEGDGTAPLLMEVQGDDLLTPALQAGLYRYEIRCGGVTVLAGHVHVLPSPLGAASGEAVLVAQADVSSPLVQCTVTLGVGPRGPQGYSAYEAASRILSTRLCFCRRRTTSAQAAARRTSTGAGWLSRTDCRMRPIASAPSACRPAR